MVSFLILLIIGSIFIIHLLVSDSTGFSSLTLRFIKKRKRYIMSLTSKSSDVTVFPRKRKTIDNNSKVQGIHLVLNRNNNSPVGRFL